MWRWGLLGCWVLALSACDGATQLLVIVDSDFGPALGTVEVSASSDGVATQRRFEVASTGLPFSFAVVPDDPSVEQVRVAVAGLDAAGSVLVGYHVQTRFLSGRTLRLEVPLTRACVREPSCVDMGMRCHYGECVEEAVDPSSLPQGSGPPTALFAGPAPAPDAGVAPTDGGECEAACHDEANPCRVGTTSCDGDVPECRITTTLAPGSPCGEGRLCDETGQCGA